MRYANVSTGDSWESKFQVNVKERGRLILSRSNVNLYAMKNFAENYQGKTAQRGNTFTCPRREIKKEREGGN